MCAERLAMSYMVVLANAGEKACRVRLKNDLHVIVSIRVRQRFATVRCIVMMLEFSILVGKLCNFPILIAAAEIHA